MDIQSRADIELLMNTFYDKVKRDDTIGYIFNEVARVDWDHHIPIICDFWETILLGATSYRNNAMGVHYALNRKEPFQKIHFDRWLHLFNESIDDLFAGTVATTAKKRAQSIASLMLFKMQQENEGLHPGKPT